MATSRRRKRRHPVARERRLIEKAIIGELDGRRVTDEQHRAWQADPAHFVPGVVRRLDLEAALLPELEQLEVRDRIRRDVDALLETLPRLATTSETPPGLLRRQRELAQQAPARVVFCSSTPMIDAALVDSTMHALVMLRRVLAAAQVEEPQDEVELAEQAMAAGVAPSTDEISEALGKSSSWLRERRATRKHR